MPLLNSRFVLALVRNGFAAIGLLMLFAGHSTAGVFGGLVDKALELSSSKQSRLAIPVSLPPAGSFATCQHLFPRGAVLDASRVDPQARPLALCSSHFAVLYSGRSKTPLVVVERLNRQQMAEALDEARTDEFFADPRLPRSARADLDDYRGTGFDRGHLAPAGDQPDQASMAQSFVLSNIVPQDPTHNRKVWAKIESDVRKYVRRAQGNVYVYSGPLFHGAMRTIGRNQVWVPSHLFKLVYDEASGRSWAYVLPNAANARIQSPMDYSSFVQQTGLQLLDRAPG